MQRLPADAHRLSVGIMEFQLADIDRRIAHQLRRLDELKVAVEERAGADPVLRGTNVPVHIIAALAHGETHAEIIDDYPSLTQAQIEAAIEYAKVYPKPGRPLPARSFKRMLADMAQSGVWDVDTDDHSTERPPMT